MSQTEHHPAFAAARQICRRHARSFYFASHFLPRERRNAAYAVYAFCRQMDDAVDEATSTESANENLDRFRARLSEVYRPPSPCTRGEGRGEGLREPNALILEHASQDRPSPSVPLPCEYKGEREARSTPTRVDHAFRLTVEKYAIPQQPFLDLLAGCEMDLTLTRYASWQGLELYCYRVAGCVGLIMSRVFGLENHAAQQQAVLMGNAMQLTNILRDVGEDFATRGRVYLPLDEIDRFGYSIDLLSRGVVNTAFIKLMRFQIARARAMFREASAGLCYLANDGSRLTATTMAVIYSGILDAIERQDYDVFTKRARVSLPRKLARLPKCWRLSRREAGQPLPDIFENKTIATEDFADGVD